MRIELEYGKGRRKTYLSVDLETEEILVDISLFPPTCFLCACFDGIGMHRIKVGEKGKSERTFLNIKWLIEEWGGPKELVEAMKVRREKVINDIPALREKYKDLAS